MLQKLKKVWFNQVTLKRYKYLASYFGDMLSYSHLGEPVGFQAIKQKLKKYNQILLNHNLRPYTMQELNESGWSGQDLPELTVLNEEQHKQIFLSIWEEDEAEVQNILKTQFLRNF